MEARKVLSSLCYFSIFFAGFLFPLIVYFVSGDEVTKAHAKKSLLSHLIPLIPTALMVFTILNDIFTMPDRISVSTIISLVLLLLTWCIVVIWNIIKGVKVLISE
ncbi:DUF4870 domain-containing protein [Bacillus sp. sid0103]|uniref:DUF4870 domain-containing protein n=1 Tax=Bacillus sp. sid0103 TaxID=2856337 RepID=UPI001C481EC4|nr:DUF4870 domain-containing protein [Bacillus sp. sid0103]MBV7505787.1 DUF4870 domain-containing protein [Bacillus sp. sid0103]